MTLGEIVFSKAMVLMAKAMVLIEGAFYVV